MTLLGVILVIQEERREERREERGKERGEERGKERQPEILKNMQEGGFFAKTVLAEIVGL